MCVKACVQVFVYSVYAHIHLYEWGACVFSYVQVHMACTWGGGCGQWTGVDR